MAALADSDDVVRWLSSEQLCAAAGMADRSYRRARCELLESAEVELLDGAGGRGNTNVWQVRASADAPARMARPSRRRVIPPAGTKPLLATVASPADELPAVETPAQTPAQTPAETPAPNARAGKEPQNPRIPEDPPSPPAGGSPPDSIVIEQTYVTERGRKRRRSVRVDLDEVRGGLGLPTRDDRAVWQQVRALLLDAVGESTFEIWLEPIELIAIDGSGALVLAVPEQTSSWVRERFGRLLSRCVERAGREWRLASEPERRALEHQDQPKPASARGVEKRPEGGIVMVTVVANQKGGVGKTTTAANVGVGLALRRRRVLVVDADPQFALTRQLGLQDHGCDGAGSRCGPHALAATPDQQPGD